MSQDKSTNLPNGTALILLGSNVMSKAGGPVETLRAALDTLAQGPMFIVAQSRFFVSPFFPVGAQPDVVNAVVQVSTDLSPDALMSCLHEIEADFDRKRDLRWSNRTLDLDILTFNEFIAPDQSTLREWVNLSPEEQREKPPKTLILPHPRLQDRAFALVPACDIAPDWRHPLSGKTMRDMRDALPPEDVASVRPIED